MIGLYVAACAVSFAAGLVAGAIIGGVLLWHPAYQKGRRDALADRTSRETVRRRLLALVIAPPPLPAAQRDHADARLLHLVRIGGKRR